MQEIEIWKPITGYEGLYEVSNLGRVRSLDVHVVNSFHSNGHIHKGSVLHPNNNNSLGYDIIWLHKGGARERFYVHRLVACAFIPNPDNLPVVNHKDENKKNNRAENLEWCDQRHNISYGSTTERRLKSLTDKNCKTKPRKINQYTISGEFVSSYRSANHAAKVLGVFEQNIDACARGYRGKKTAYGYVWKYAEDEHA